MSSVQGQRRAWWQTILLLTLCLLCACQAAIPLFPSSDFWAHAAVGRWIWQHGEVPHHALFLWTESEPWVAHSWLSQVALYAALAAGGAWLTRTCAVVMVSLSYLLIWFVWRRHAPAATVMIILFGLAVNCSNIRYQARPELFSALFLSYLLTVLVRWTDWVGPGGTDRKAVLSVLTLPLLFCVWVNCHGQVLLGAALLGVAVCCDLVQDRFSRRARLLALAGVLCAGALLVNPYGVGYWEAYRLTTSSVILASIREWQPCWATPPLPQYLVLGTLVPTLLAAIVWSANPKRRWAHLGWLLIACFCFVRAIRFIWMLNLVNLIVLAASAELLDPGRLWDRLTRRQAAADAVGAARFQRLSWLLRTVVFVWLLTSFIEPFTNMAFVLRAGSPDQIADFVAQKHIPGHMFNDYENSGFLEWRLGGEPPLFIDLLNVYSDQLFLDYLDINAATPRGRKLLDERGIGFVVLTRFRPDMPLGPLVHYLHDDRLRWKMVYGSHDGYVFARRSELYKHLDDVSR